MELWFEWMKDTKLEYEHQPSLFRVNRLLLLIWFGWVFDTQASTEGGVHRKLADYKESVLSAKNEIERKK
jgi:hypothetical protein